ncbi:MAG: hypothetical protein WAN87_02375 [Thermoplasmata archaeon]
MNRRNRPSSKSAPPKARSASDESAASRERQLRALVEPFDVHRRPRTFYPILEVRNPIHRTVYTVLFPEFPSRARAMCSCPDFGRRGLGTCKHIEASLLWLEDHPSEAAPDPRAGDRSRVEECWKEVDRRIGRWSSGVPLTPLGIRAPGSVLYWRSTS